MTVWVTGKADGEVRGHVIPAGRWARHHHEGCWEGAGVSERGSQIGDFGGRAVMADDTFQEVAMDKEEWKQRSWERT